MTFSVRRAVGTLTLGSAFLASLVVTGWEIGLVGVVVALVAITVLLVCSWDAPRFSVSALDAVVAAFVVWVLLVTVLRDLPWVATYQATAFLLLPLGYLVTRADGDFTWSSVWGVLVAFATSIALLSLLLVALGEPPNVYFAVRNNQAALLNVALFLSLARAPESRPLPAPLGHAIAFVLAAAIAVTGSRGGAVALVCAMVAVFLVGPAGRRSAIGVFALVVAAGFAAGTLLTMGWAAERFGDLSGGAASRWTMWRTALPLLLEHPWIGHGLGMTELAWAPIRDAYEGSHGRFLHNDYLQYAIEAGVPAALSLALMPLVALRAAVRSAAADLRATAAMGAVATVAIHNLVDYHLQLPPLILAFGLALGALGGASALTRDVPARGARIGLAALGAALCVLAAVFAAYQAALPGAYDRTLRKAGGYPMVVAGFLDPLDDASASDWLARLETAMRLQPHADEPLIVYGGVLRQLGRYDEADAAFARALELNPYAYQAHYQWALADIARGRRAVATDRLTAAVRLQPRFLAAHGALVRLHLAAGRDAAAYRQTREAFMHARGYNHRQLWFLELALEFAAEHHDPELERRVEHLLDRRTPD